MKQIDVINLMLTAADEDKTEAGPDGSAAGIEIRAKSTLNTLWASGEVFGNDNRNDDTLADVRYLLDRRIGYFKKLDLLKLAVVLWPEERFTTKSLALNQFLHAYVVHVRDLQAS